MLQLASSEQTKIMAQWPKVRCQGANIQPLFLQVSHLCLKRPHRQPVKAWKTEHTEPQIPFSPEDCAPLLAGNELPGDAERRCANV